VFPGGNAAADFGRRNFELWRVHKTHLLAEARDFFLERIQLDGISGAAHHADETASRYNLLGLPPKQKISQRVAAD
jgi:hypothetical protein